MHLRGFIPVLNYMYSNLALFSVQLAYYLQIDSRLSRLRRYRD